MIADHGFAPISEILRYVRSMLDGTWTHDPRFLFQACVHHARALVVIHTLDGATRLLNTEIAKAVYRERMEHEERNIEVNVTMVGYA